MYRVLYRTSGKTPDNFRLGPQALCFACPLATGLSCTDSMKRLFVDKNADDATSVFKVSLFGRHFDSYPALSLFVASEPCLLLLLSVRNLCERDRNAYIAPARQISKFEALPWSHDS